MSATNRPKRKSKPTARIAGLIRNNMPPTFNYKAARKAVGENRKLVLDRMQGLAEHQNHAPEEESQEHL